MPRLDKMSSLDDMNLACFKTQHPWIQLHGKPKCMWVWQGAPNILEFGYMLSASIYGSDEMSSPISLSLTTH